MNGIVATVSNQTLPHLEALKEAGAVILRCNGSFEFPDLDRMREVGLPILYDIPGDRSMFGKKRTSPMSDDEILQLAVKSKIAYVGVSYATCGADIRRVRDRIYELDPNAVTKIVGKLETAGACVNTDEIINESDMCLIDRGDLSSAIGPENVPAMQPYLISRCRALNTRVICATEMMMSTLNNEKPSCADVADVYQAVLAGADYVMCSEETAIGKDPLVPVLFMTKVINTVVQSRAFRLHDGMCPVDDLKRLKYAGEKLPRININRHQALDCNSFANGAFSPLTGFLNARDTSSVASNMRVASGAVWPVPILLQVSAEEHAAVAAALTAAGASTGTLVDDNASGSAALGGKATDAKTKQGVIDSTCSGGTPVRYALWADDESPLALIDVEDAFVINLPEITKKIFGAKVDEHHPGAKFLADGGPMCIGGRITLLKLPDMGIPEQYALTPAQVRAHIKKKGWKTTVGFQTRNLGHRAHEHLQKVGLEQTDGLLIHPLLGWKKKGDMMPEVILDGYEMLTKKYYNRDRVKLAGLVVTMRYAGPKEAVFHAVVRRNYGCTHFIVGRDHAGVGSYYGKYEAHKIFERFNEAELGIKVLKLSGPFHCAVCDGIVTEKSCPHAGTAHALSISGTEVRRLIKAGERPNERFMRPEVSDFLIQRAKEGKAFVQ